MQTRARRSRGAFIENKDLLPDFYSIERDANQFGLNNSNQNQNFGILPTLEEYCSDPSIYHL